MEFKIRQLAASAALALAAAVPAAAQSFHTLDAGGGLYLHQAGGRAALREPGGRVSELTLPTGTVLRNLARIDGGWLLSGELDEAAINELFLLRSRGGRQTSLPAPPNASGDDYRAGPLPLVEGGRLAGLAWLSGAGIRQTAVWAAAWNGRDWSPPELVSPPGPGTQIAISGAVLADGSWLLAWAAHDGGDDEILWSRRVGGRWTAPALLHAPNDTPDITPSVVASGTGALAAWSWFDGAGYRVKRAVFRRAGWRELAPLGPPGSVRPELTAGEGGALLLYRTVSPAAWALHELDERGTVLGSALAEEATTLRPALVSHAGARPAFEWPGATAATPRRVAPEWRPEP